MSLTLAERSARADQRRTLRWYEQACYRVRVLKIVLAFLLFVLFWAATPYYLPLVIDPDPAKAAANEAAAYAGNLSRQIAMPILTLVALFLLWRFRLRGRVKGHLIYVVWAYIVWTVASFAWSESPDTTDKRLIVFCMNLLLCYAFARVLSMLEIASLGMMICSLTAVASFIADAVVQGQFAPMDPSYRFQGVMTANYQAENLVVLILCALTLVQKRPRWLKPMAAWIGIVLVLLYLTRSRLSSIICIVLAAGMGIRIARTRLKVASRGVVYVAIAAIVVPSVVYLTFAQGESAAQGAFMMGRTDTENTSNLSNRAPLWAELWDTGVAYRPWLGYGYAGFWTPARVEKISYDQGWMVPHAHNTYLDQVLSIGIPGALLYIAALWGAALVAWRRNYRERTAESLLPAALLTWVALTGMAESVPVDPYLPTLLAYTCVMKMCLLPGSETQSEKAFDTEPILLGAPLPTESGFQQ
jgi:exopolysaccharide production protein ExoQ